MALYKYSSFPFFPLIRRPYRDVLVPASLSPNTAVFAGLTNVTRREIDRQTDRHTDHATLSVVIGGIGSPCAEYKQIYLIFY